MSEMRVIEPGSISEWVWENKYRFKPAAGGGDATVGDTCMRVARALASVEEEQGRWTQEFASVMRSFEFLPAGRIIAGAGTGRSVTMSNCFVMPQIEDSMAGIMKSVSEAAMTLRSGGGVGMDFSTIRPRGARVIGLDAEASGPVSFMELWHTMCGTIMSAGARRGAMMGVLRCDHPDIEEFITAKQKPGQLTNFNVSVAVTDDFVRAVRANAEWPLVFKGQVYRTVKAAELWSRIIGSTYEYAEPGILFIDRINRDNPLSHTEYLYATNPCGEQPLPPGGACLLGSINLARLIRNPFTTGAMMDRMRLDGVVRTAIRMLDNVNDVSAYPMPYQQEEAQIKRRIGLGITGLADALIMFGLRYGSNHAAEWFGNIMREIRRIAEEATTDLGSEKGSFPLLSAEFPGCPDDRRNSHLMSIAPTGTISLLAGNVSSGIEPVFAWEYTRRLLQPDGKHKEVRVEDYVVRLARYLGVETKGDAWVTTDDLSVDEHLRMAAAAQPHVDSAISKTINCPAAMPFDEFERVYMKAYDLGLKGCTTYRPSGTRGAVLVRDEDQTPKAAAPPTSAAGNVIHIGEPLARDEMLRGRTYKLKPSGSEHALYVTINDTMLHGRRRPFEMFINTKAVESYPWIVAMARMISAVWRKGGDVAFVGEELQQVFDPRGGYFHAGRYVPSVCAGIGDIIARHLRETGVMTEEIEPTEKAQKRHCPKCQTGGLDNREGCWTCDTCDYTKCG